MPVYVCVFPCHASEIVVQEILESQIVRTSLALHLLSIEIEIAEPDGSHLFSLFAYRVPGDWTSAEVDRNEGAFPIQVGVLICWITQRGATLRWDRKSANI